MANYKPAFYRINQAEHDKRSAADYTVNVDFDYIHSEDLIVKGGVFHSFWNGERWSDSITDLIRLVDNDVRKKKEEILNDHPDATVKTFLMNYESSGVMTRFANYCKKSESTDVIFNKHIFFDNETVTRDDYSTYQLPYHPQSGKTPAYDELISVLYKEEEAKKFMWAIGALFSGDMPKIEKFLYFYGPAGTGKGTVLKIIKQMLGEYIGTIDLEVLTGGSEFATGQIKELPVLIDADTKIDQIRKDINLLKLVSHEELVVRRLHTNGYPVTFNGLLITASNNRYNARNADSGINRRALVVHPTGETVPMGQYNQLMSQIQFEIPYIAQKCIDVYKELGMAYYNDERDEDMIRWNDTVYGCILENHLVFEKGITLKQATNLYLEYLNDLEFSTKGARPRLREEIGNYFNSYAKDKMIDGVRVTSYYYDFKYEKFPSLADKAKPKKETTETTWLDLKEQKSLFDSEARDYPAQYTNTEGNPLNKWDNVTTTLGEIDTSKLHFVRVPESHIILDFDLRNEQGEKDLELNIKEASNFPPTYAEVSKSGGGLHLHYWYDGDVTKLAPTIKDKVEVKVFTGKSSLRRMLSKCNDLEVAHIATGLPLKEVTTTMYKDVEDIHWTESKLRNFIQRAIDKEHHGATKPEIDFVYSQLTKAEETGVQYDLRDMFMPLMKFAMGSTNKREYCIEMVSKMPLSTIQTEEQVYNGNDIIDDEEIVFFDIEVFSNLFLVCWKKNHVKVPEWVFDDLRLSHTDTVVNVVQSKDMLKLEWYAQNEGKYGIWFNPSAQQIESLMMKPLIGFNNRKYDNHIIYNASLGATPMELYQQSQNIINRTGDGGMKAGAYNISYADLYEFMDIKQSLKKWEIQLGIKHDEFEFPWDKPLDQSNWIRCAQYCMHDVEATDIVFNNPDFGQAAWMARKVLCELTDMAPNTKTQTLAEKFLFGDDPRPQDKFNYYDLAREFPGYTFDPNRKPKSDYKGKDPSEGGYVSSKPGVYGVSSRDYLNNHILYGDTGRSKLIVYIDVASLHPHSLIAINYFGPYTPKFKALVDCRIMIKHKKLDEAAHAFDKIDPTLSEKLSKYLSNPELSSSLAHAMKIVINIVYGMTSAPYDNKFRDPRNVDNIVAKRGALFMMMLEEEMTERGCNIIHVKTDSMKITNYLPEDIDYAMKRANEFGYTFEIECIYDRVALVNKAVLIGHHEGEEEYGRKAWEAVGAQFAEPFVYKKLFSHEEITEGDFMNLKSVQKGSIYLGERFIGKNADVYASQTGEDLLSSKEVNIAQSVQARMMKPIDKYLPKRDYVDLPQNVVQGNRVARIAKELKISEDLVRTIINNGYPETNITKFNSVTGTKGYKWRLSSEYRGKEDIDMYYYKRLVDEAVDSIYDVGDGNIIFEGTKYAR